MSFDAEAKMQFLFALRSKGVTDKAVLNAMESIDRGRFIQGYFTDRAYDDMPLPIACGQTISQPSVVGLMTQALKIGGLRGAGTDQYHRLHRRWVLRIARPGAL